MGRFGSLGSSPLTRGKRAAIFSRIAVVRLIPTHAGKTDGSVPNAFGLRAHPRSRGENQAIQLLGSSFQGSSPLTRGKQALHTRPIHHHGLIPAHAGKTLTPPRMRPGGRADPRSRGENDDTGGETRVVPGSSPLTRGKRQSLGSRRH